MLVRDAQIVAIRYQYADVYETSKAKEIVKAIDDECSAFFKRVIDESELEMIPLAA